MSQALTNFTAAAAAGTWAVAVENCNGLDMPEMLQGLNSLPRNVLDDFQAQLVVYANAYGAGIDRIVWAIHVVKDRRLPASAPGDLQTSGQVQQAASFLATAGQQHAVNRKRLKITIFWTRNAHNEAFSPLLIQKAQNLLHSNGDKFTLDVLPVRTVLPTDKTLSEASPESCADSEFTEVQQLATATQVHQPDRLPVIFYLSESVLGPYGGVRDPIGHGCGYQPSPGHGFAMINARGVATDNVTLLHELGHGAGLSHEPDGTKNFMTYDADRSVINAAQLVQLGQAFFCA